MFTLKPLVTRDYWPVRTGRKVKRGVERVGPLMGGCVVGDTRVHFVKKGKGYRVWIIK